MQTEKDLSVYSSIKVYKVVEYTKYIINNRPNYLLSLEKSIYTKYWADNPDLIEYIEVNNCPSNLRVILPCNTIKCEFDYNRDKIYEEINKNIKIYRQNIKLKNQSIDTVNNSLPCSLCLINKENIVKIKCSHKFCESCIMDWLSNHTTCPECKQDVEDYSLKV